MRSFLLFRGSPAVRDLFYDLSTGDTCPLRIPFDRSFDLEALDRLRAAASPSDKS